METFQDNNHFLRLCFKRSTFWLISSYQCIRFLTRISISPIDDHFAPIGSRYSSGAGRGHKTPNSSHQQPYPYPSVKWSRCAIASVTALSYQDPHWVVTVFWAGKPWWNVLKVRALDFVSRRDGQLQIELRQPSPKWLLMIFRFHLKKSF